MPVIVAVVLVGVPRGVGFGGVVGAAELAGGLAGQGRVGGEEDGALAEEEVDVAFEPDGEAEVGAGGEDHGATTGGGGGGDGGVDGGGIENFAGAGCAKGPDVEEERSIAGAGGGGLREGGGEAGEGERGEFQEVATEGIHVAAMLAGGISDGKLFTQARWLSGDLGIVPKSIDGAD